MDSSGYKRKIWTRTETMLLLKCYEARKDEFAHPRLKKRAYSNVLEDMVFQEFEDTTVTEVSLANKMRTLLAAYKTAKDACGRTGASAAVIPYMEQMDDIFGKNATISNTHCLNLGSALKTVPRAVSATVTITTTSSPPAAIREPTPPPNAIRATTPPPAAIRVAPAPAAVRATPPPAAEAAPPSAEAQSTSRKRKKSAKELYYEQKRISLQRRDEVLQELLAAKFRQVEAEERRNDLLKQLMENIL